MRLWACRGDLRVHRARACVDGEGKRLAVAFLHFRFSDGLLVDIQIGSVQLSPFCCFQFLVKNEQIIPKILAVLLSRAKFPSEFSVWQKLADIFFILMFCSMYL